jgi:hypothetical protein
MHCVVCCVGVVVVVGGGEEWLAGGRQGARSCSVDLDGTRAQTATLTLKKQDL